MEQKELENIAVIHLISSNCRLIWKEKKNLYEIFEVLSFNINNKKIVQ